MPLVSKCPKCRELVTIPDGLDPDAEVRCPLCVAVYPLREALAEAPPALIPVGTGAIGGPGPDSQAMLESGLVSEPFHVPESGRAPGPVKMEAEVPVAEGPLLDVWQKVDVAPQIDTGAADEAAPAIDTGGAAVDAEQPAAFELAAPRGRYQPAGVAPLKRPQKKKSAVRFLAEVFLGGVLGLTIGYYLLCWALWVLGSQRDFPKLPLPLLPHTMHWFASTEKPNNGPGQLRSGGDRGVTHLKSGEFDKAIAEFTKDIRLDPADATAYGNRAAAYVLKGEFGKAIDDYTEAIRLNPRLAGAYHGRAVAYDCSGQLDKAIADYNEAIRLNPEYAEAYDGRGNAYAEKDEFDKAIADYTEAIRLNPMDYAPYANRGKAYKEKGEKAKAEADFARAKQLGYQPE